MRSPSSTTRSEPLIAARLLTVGLCACGLLQASPSDAASATSEPPTVLNVQYGNQAARASLQVDLQANDVYVEMTGRAPRGDSSSAAVPASAASMPMREINTSEDGRNSSHSSSSRTDSVFRREETRSIVEAAGRAEARDSVTARVVGAIRKAQEAFYQGNYADAQRLAQSSLEEHPTAEGYALSGSIAWVQKDYTTAGRQWRAALALNPEYPGVSAMLQKLPGKEAP